MEFSEGVPILRFSCFDEQKDWMGMGFSTRLGGVSEGCLSELNLGWNRGDSEDIVKENYHIMCKALGVQADKLVFSDQIHETEIVDVTEKYAAGASLTKKLRGIDGMITKEPGLVLATSYADCVPLFFADPVHHAVASSHSGWRGTVGEIGRRTVEKMQECFGTHPEDLICLIGPSICRDCYEVSEDVAEQFQEKFPEECISEIIAPGVEAGKYQLDLWAACYFTLQKAGVPSASIQVSGVCTCCHNDILFSHRATSGKRGNLNGFIWKKS
ncbi:MAG: peptidoglycan editing factor PgeF [Lachnospiraceae bacterium]|nr:peptidoglycan editing factor PgeF [Lachnospiraceae bacterium]